ncbi:DUF3899 domain-containing protein [Furfurilactobacillus entadae]|uniref:DUF3899 domain-containing protein n=1 Tax=Furfurilactobacillus entadae TaxID=2922307 RepID=UPI0035F0CA73
MNQKTKPMWWLGGLLVLMLLGGGVAIACHVTIVTVSNVFFMSGLFLIAIGAVMQLSHANLFAGFRRRKRLKGQAADEDDQPMNMNDIVIKKNQPLRLSNWNRWFLVTGGVLIVVAIVITL